MKQKSSFTLLELLITIGIIALLAGILFPVMSQVRASARRTSCMNNLKQIGTGLELYGAASSYRLRRFTGPRRRTSGHGSPEPPSFQQPEDILLSVRSARGDAGKRQLRLEHSRKRAANG